MKIYHVKISVCCVVRGIFETHVTEESEMLATFTLYNSYTAICGYHICKDVPNPFFGEIVCCEREERNNHDPYAVALKNAGTGAVGHVPQTISCICTLFLRQGGIVTASVTGPHRYSADLVQGGKEVPCKYIFTGGENSIKKAHFNVNDEQDGLGEIEGLQTVHIKKKRIFCSLAADTNGVNSKIETDNPMTQITVDTMLTSMPCVVVKTETVDNECPPESLESNGAWVKTKDIALI